MPESGTRGRLPLEMADRTGGARSTVLPYGKKVTHCGVPMSFTIRISHHSSHLQRYALVHYTDVLILVYMRNLT